MARIVVVGSINMDLVATSTRLPLAGETLMGRNFITVPGGKGANQAYGVGKLGGEVAMVAAIGADAFGEQAVANLASVGVDVSCVKRIADAPTGVALIVVDDMGQNSIVVVPGANTTLACDDLDLAATAYMGAEVCLLQLEIPLPTVEHAVRLAKKHGAKVVLDPAPARSLPDDLLGMIDFLTPNQVEAEVLTGIRISSPATAMKAATKLRQRGTGHILVKMGAYGVFYLGPDGGEHIQGFRVKSVDTTAAGDAFNAGLAVALDRGYCMTTAVRYANAVAALSVTKPGAQSSMPTAVEVEDFLTAQS